MPRNERSAPDGGGATAPRIEPDVPEAGEGRPRDVDSPSGLPVVDGAALLARVGGSATLLSEIVDLYRDERGRLSARLHEAIDGADPEAFAAAAHALKGVVANLAGTAAFAVADRLHLMALSSDLASGAATAPQLDRELERLETALISLAKEYGSCES